MSLSFFLLFFSLSLFLFFLLSFCSLSFFLSFFLCFFLCPFLSLFLTLFLSSFLCFFLTLFLSYLLSFFESRYPLHPYCSHYLDSRDLWSLSISDFFHYPPPFFSSSSSPLLYLLLTFMSLSLLLFSPFFSFILFLACGAKTPLSKLTTLCVVLIALSTLTQTFNYIPQVREKKKKWMMKKTMEK